MSATIVRLGRRRRRNPSSRSSSRARTRCAARDRRLRRRRRRTSSRRPPAGRSSNRRATARWPSARWRTPVSATSPTRSRRITARRSGSAARPARARKSVGVIAEDVAQRPDRNRRGRSASSRAITPSTNPGGDAGEQHHQRAEGAQRDRRRAVAEGRAHARAAARVRPRRARPRSARRAISC